MKYKKIMALCLCGVMMGAMLTGCHGKDADNNNSEENRQVTESGSEQGNIADDNLGQNDEGDDNQSGTSLEKFDVKVEFDEADTTDTYENIMSRITLKDNGSSADGEGVDISGNTIKIEKPGVYVITGELTDGQVKVNVKETGTVQLVLDGVHINNSSTSPLFIKNAEKAVITLAEGSINEISDGENYEFEDTENQEPNSAVFSKENLTFNGTGTLKVTSSYNNAIRCKDGLKFVNGTYELVAVNNAISGKDYVAVRDGSYQITASGDGIKSNNSKDAKLGYVYIEGGKFNITAENDGIQATTCMKISDGDFTIKTGGGSSNAQKKSQDKNFGRPFMEQEEQSEESVASCKGIKAGVDITISGGNFQMDTADDSVHSNGSITVAGGKLELSTGDDGIHGDTDVIIDDGIIKVVQSYEGIEGCTITVNGGEIEVSASDDGFNAAGGNDSSATGGKWGRDQFAEDTDAYMIFNAGVVKVNASGDGLDSNGKMTFNGGEIYVEGPTDNGNAALDSNGTIAVNGGTIAAAGSSGMLESPADESKQNVFVVTYAQVQPAGTKVSIQDEKGNELYACTPSKQFASVIVSMADFKTNETYTVYTGDSKTGEIPISQSVMNLSSDGTVSAGSKGSAMGGMKGGGMGGKRDGARKDFGGNADKPQGNPPNDGTMDKQQENQQDNQQDKGNVF